MDRLNEACARAGLAWVHRVSSHVRITRNLGGGRVEGVLVRKTSWTSWGGPPTVAPSPPT